MDVCLGTFKGHKLSSNFVAAGPQYEVIHLKILLPKWLKACAP